MIKYGKTITRLKVTSGRPKVTYGRRFKTKKQLSSVSLISNSRYPTNLFTKQNMLAPKYFSTTQTHIKKEIKYLRDDLEDLNEDRKNTLYHILCSSGVVVFTDSFFACVWLSCAIFFRYEISKDIRRKNEELSILTQKLNINKNETVR
jgi:hypothetical protein